MSMQKKKIAQINDLSEGQMKSISISDDHEIVLAKVDGDFFAVYGKCTHYGAPLADGALNGCRLVCPWHHACFDVKTGRHLEAPGLDGLPSFEVTVKGEDIFVSLPGEMTDRIPNKMVAKDKDNQQKYVVLGGGAAGAYAVEGIREAGFTGEVILITKEEEMPYDRPNCSKDYLMDEAPEEWMPLRDKAFYEQRDIQLLQGKKVKEANVATKTLLFDDGNTLEYDKLLVCTGGTPRELSIEGSDLGNIHTLRSLADSRQIRDLAKESKKVVVIGSSFIGLEGAQSLRYLGCEVSVVAPEKVPFAKTFGEKIGRKIQQMHEEAGIKFHLQQKPKRFLGNGKVNKVELESGKTIEADLVVVGVGVSPATHFLKGVPLETDGSLLVDEYLAVNNACYAAGDIAKYPYHGTPTRIEHWKVAAQQGRIAGMNMAGAEQKFQAVPFFWTVQQGTPMQYVGHAHRFDEIIFDGNPDEDQFIAFFVENNLPKAALGMGRDKEMAIVQELMLEDEMPEVDKIKAGVDWDKLI